ncbi:hypothetical protein MOTT12_04757 [Mycobacterium intracellulare subsp. yongonense]|nr:hypothetical protein MOTT12_04757 [Mycobacterium intracellulare subsp. yongonense]ARR85482.1 hypothetical protein MOTT27_04661 [Mycobacterium intracellulare subsp. yongonense]
MGQVAAKVRHAHYSTVTPRSGLVRGAAAGFSSTARAALANAQTAGMRAGG